MRAIFPRNKIKQGLFLPSIIPLRGVGAFSFCSRLSSCIQWDKAVWIKQKYHNLYLWHSFFAAGSLGPSPRPILLLAWGNHPTEAALGSLLKVQTADKLNKHGSCCHNRFAYKACCSFTCSYSSSQEPKKDRWIIPQHIGMCRESLAPNICTRDRVDAAVWELFCSMFALIS